MPASKPTDKQRRFAEEYLVDLNATQAAIRAGYSARNARKIGSETLGKPAVQELVRKAMQARSDRTFVTQDQVLLELAKIGFSKIDGAVDWDGQQLKLKPFSDIEEDCRAALSEVSEMAHGGLKIKFHDKVAALTKLGQHLGMFVNRHEVSGRDGQPVAVVVTPEQIETAEEWERTVDGNGS